ncbi:hypothetical protein [endosymbiont of Lamellibrachia barhami]|nr:hypothetical protein [endosymbiont of Lamellibrachia barhami]
MKRVLVVDDSADDIHFVIDTFLQEYAVLAATDRLKRNNSFFWEYG